MHFCVCVCVCLSTCSSAPTCFSCGMLPLWGSVRTGLTGSAQLEEELSRSNKYISDVKLLFKAIPVICFPVDCILSASISSVTEKHSLFRVWLSGQSHKLPAYSVDCLTGLTEWRRVDRLQAALVLATWNTAGAVRPEDASNV